MKELKKYQIGVTYAGCFLGAGFISGQELWQFFGSFGKWGFFGLFIALAALYGLGILVLRLSQLTGIDDMGKIVTGPLPAIFRKLIVMMECVFMFGIIAIMVAGIGALLQQLLSVPAWLVSLFAAAMLCFLSLSGFAGLVRIFSAVVPLIVFASLLFSVLAFFGDQTELAAAILPEEENPLLPNWFIAACTYAAYNLFGSIGVIAPLGKHIHGKKKVFHGILLGCILLAFVAYPLIISMCMNPAYTLAELPMLALATDLRPVWAYGYGFLLLLGMIGTALASLVALEKYCQAHLLWAAKRKKAVCTMIGGSGYLASLAGFGDLIGFLYPIFGYASLLAFVLLIIHFIYVKKHVNSIRLR